MANSNNAVTVQSSGATLILAANANRVGVTLYNNGSVTVYIGVNSSVSTSNGIVLAAAGAYDFNGWKCYRGDIYGIAASATADMRYLEWTQ